MKRDHDALLRRIDPFQAFDFEPDRSETSGDPSESAFQFVNKVPMADDEVAAAAVHDPRTTGASPFCSQPVGPAVSREAKPGSVHLLIDNMPPTGFRWFHHGKRHRNRTGATPVDLNMPNDIESLDDFKNSFAYGSRNDLSFKFLKRLNSDEAAEFVRLVLREVGELFDGAPPERLIDLAYEWQVKAYCPRPGEQRPHTYDDRPFAPLDRALANTTLGLVTSSGHFPADQDPMPFGVARMTQDEAIGRIDDFLRATPELMAIPRETPESSLRVRHPGYDVRSVLRDPGVAFPRALLVEAERDELIGRLSDELYSFVGACAQGRIRREAPGWVERWKTAGIEALLLVPV